MKKVFSLSLLIAAMVMGFTSCNKEVKVTGVSVDLKEKTIGVGESFTIKATVTPNNAKNTKVVWKTSDATVATVSGGKVTGVKEGTATITVITEDGGKTDACKVKIVKSMMNDVKVDIPEFAYIGNLEYGEGYHIYVLFLTLEGTIVDGKRVKNTTIWYLPFCSDALGQDLIPSLGAYNISLDKKYKKKTFNANYAYVMDVPLTGKPSNQRTFTEGTLVFETNGLRFKGKDEESNEYNIVYSGTFNIKDNSPKPWKYEPETPTTKTEEFTQGEFKVFKKNSRTKLYVTLSKNNNGVEIQGLLEIFIAENAQTLKPGTYMVSDSKAIGTLLKSEGLNERLEIIGCALYYNNTTNSSETIFYIDSGQAVITADEINFSGKSHFGSTITMKYKGNMDFQTGTTHAPVRVTNKKE
ncbi:MAG: Ig-like domain-containing protein [Porphyromonadaceae bacterium]|nr:Ig-like domain-containing protein [Porphyromonadaceae bacterium]